jgi:hypothetical protein
VLGWLSRLPPGVHLNEVPLAERLSLVPVDYSRNSELFAQLHDGVLD